ANVVGHHVGELAGLIEAVVREADDGPLNQQPDSVQREEHDGLARNGRALAVPEAPVPVRHVAGDGGDDDGDGGRRQRTKVEREVHPAVDEVVDDDASAADDAELGALVDEQPETLVEPSQSAHRSSSIWSGHHRITIAAVSRRATWPCYPRRTPPKHYRMSKHCRQDYRAGRQQVPRAACIPACYSFGGVGTRG